MKGIGAGRWFGAVVVAATVLAGCGDPDESTESGDSVAATGDADRVVVAAVEEVLGDGPFRSLTTGQIPFLPDLEFVYEQSGDDVVDITISDGSGSATVISGDTAYEWDATSQAWRETPLESFDPLLGAGFLLGLSLKGLFEVPAAPLDEFEEFEEFEEFDEFGDVLPVATGWTEVDRGADGARHFERKMPSTAFLGQPGRGGDVPVERLEEDAITGEFYRSAEVTSSVEIGPDGNLARNRVRAVFDGSADYPDCAPLERLVGTTEMVVEFSDVGTDFAITVSDPAELVAEFPQLAEAPNPSERDTDPIDSAFRNESGERDLSGCPAAAASGSTPTTRSGDVVVEAQSSVDRMIDSVEQFELLRRAGATQEAEVAGGQATKACDRLIFEQLSELPRNDLESAISNDIVLSCATLSAAIFEINAGGTPPQEPGDIAEALQRAWESYLAST